MSKYFKLYFEYKKTNPSIDIYDAIEEKNNLKTLCIDSSINKI